MCMTEFCGSSDYCNKCVNNPNGDKRKMTIEMYEDVMKHLQIDKYRELIIKQDQKITELEKDCEETQKLLDKQIEATHKLDIENERLNKKYAEICEKVKKAKILLGRFLWDFNNDHYHIIRDEAEQFLNSEVEK